MTAEPSTSKWRESLETNSELRELATYHHAALLRNISKRKANETDSPKERKKRVKKIVPLPSFEPVPQPIDSQPQPEPWRRLPRRKPAVAYTFNRDKLPVLLSRAKEFVKKWDEPKPSKDSIEGIQNKVREACKTFTINHSRGYVDFSKPTNVMYILTELRKSLIRHEWASVKKLLKVFLRCPQKLDRITWKVLVTILYYYPGAEDVLHEFIERNRMTFNAQEILRGLLEINGMEPFTEKKKERRPKQQSKGRNKIACVEVGPSADAE